MRPVVIVGKGQLLQVFKNIITDVVDDLLPDQVGMLDLVAQADGGIQRRKQRQEAVKKDAFHILLRNADVHDLLKKLRDQHRKGGRRKHHEADAEKAFPIGF